MGLFDLFGKKSRQDTVAEKSEDLTAPYIYPGMRVEVVTFDGHVLFIAKIQEHKDYKAVLYQYSDLILPGKTTPLHAEVKIRGYNEYEKKAIYMEGVIIPHSGRVWNVEELRIVQIVNDRAFFRLSTNIEATITLFNEHMTEEQPCRMLNISVGGVCISSEQEYHKDDRFLLKVRLLATQPPSAMYCQVLRVTEKEPTEFDTKAPIYEYGCKFLELTEADQDQIAQNIFAFQCEKRKNS